MNLGMIGAGRMGAGMVRRLMKAGHHCYVNDHNAPALAALKQAGAEVFESLQAMIMAMPGQRVIWVMVPAGPVTESVISGLSSQLAAGDIVVDGGNSNFKDSARRGVELKAKGIGFVDCGTSGGIWGESRGFCLMVGGRPEDFLAIEPVLRALAPGQGAVEPSRGRVPSKSTAEQGYLHCGPAGAGHFVKMIHNGIEYGLMHAYAEGFEIMRERAQKDIDAATRYQLPLADISELWRRGSVVSSWLLDLTAIALAEDASLKRFQGKVPDSGEGRWSLEAAIEEAVPAPVLAAALFARFRSRQDIAYAEQLLSAMREQFGGHHEVDS